MAIFGGYLRDGLVTGAYTGFMAAANGIRFIVTTPAVWPLASVPVAILLPLTCALAWLGIWAAGHATTMVTGEPGTLWGHFWSWTLYIGLALAALLLALLAALALAQPLSGFALAKIVSAQERAITGRATEEAPFLAASYVSLKACLVTLVLTGAAFVPLFFVDLLFPPATIVTVPLRVLIGGWLLAWNFIDYPLSMRGLGLRSRLLWVARHFMPFTTFGLVWMLVLVIPGFYLLVLPMAVAGATTLVVERDRFD